MRSFLGLLALSFALVGCDEACTEIAVVSVSLEVRGGDDALLEDADVSFTLDGGPTRQPDYAEDGRFDLALEEDGRFEVTVTAPEHEQVQRTYDVELTDDGCHVEGVTDTVVLGQQD